MSTTHVEPLPWEALVDPEHLPVRRWYRESEAERAAQDELERTYAQQ